MIMLGWKERSLKEEGEGWLEEEGERRLKEEGWLREESVSKGVRHFFFLGRVSLCDIGICFSGFLGFDLSRMASSFLVM